VQPGAVPGSPVLLQLHAGVQLYPAAAGHRYHPGQHPGRIQLRLPDRGTGVCVCCVCMHAHVFVAYKSKRVYTLMCVL